MLHGVDDRFAERASIVDQCHDKVGIPQLRLDMTVGGTAAKLDLGAGHIDEVARVTSGFAVGILGHVADSSDLVRVIARRGS